MKRFLLGVLIMVSVVSPALSGAAGRWTAAGLRFGLHIINVKEIRIGELLVVAVGRWTYEVDWTCTPTVLVACGIMLLWFAKQKPAAYFFSCVLFAVISTFFLLLSKIVSIWTSESLGWPWDETHFTIEILVYSINLVSCLLFSEIKQRQAAHAEHETASNQPPTATARW